MSHAIPILLYHRIEDSSLSTATSPALFRRHLQFMRERGWRSLSSEQFAHLLKAGKTMPARSFLISFDDGYRNIASAALQILKEFDFNAICFLSTRILQQDAAEPGRDAYLSWDEARALQASGIVECHSHSHAHEEFSGHMPQQIELDLQTSLDLLSENLRLPRAYFTHFAWPWGKSTPEWREIAARAGFKYQYTVARQAFRAGSPIDEIPRTCFDATSFPSFQRQVWLQSGVLSPLWHVAYPFGRKLRHMPGVLRQAS